MSIISNSLLFSSVCLIVGMGLFVVLCFTKIPRLFAVLAATAVIALASTNGFFAAIMTDWITGSAEVIKNYLLVMLTGAAVGAVMTASGCSNQIALTVLNKVGRSKGPLVIIIVCFLVLVSGNTGHLWVLLPILLSICREANMPRYVGMMTYIGMVQLTQFNLVGIPGFPNILAAGYLQVSIYEVPLMSIAQFLIGVLLLYVFAVFFWKRANKRGEGYEVIPEVNYYKAPDERDPGSLPSFWFSILPLVIMVGGSFLLSQVFGMMPTYAAIIPQWFVIFLLAGICNKSWINQGEGSKMDQIVVGIEQTLPMMITTGFIGGMATVCSSTLAYNTAINKLLSLQISPYFCAFLVVVGICVVTSDGIAGMQVFFSSMTDKFMSIPGINRGALHRVIVSTACTVDDLPYAGSCYMYNTVFGYTIKSGWKYHLLGTVVVPLITALFSVVVSSICWPC